MNGMRIVSENKQERVGTLKEAGQMVVLVGKKR